MDEDGTKWQVDTSIDFTDFEADPHQWFVDQGKERGLTFFLAHDDDGVIWGKVENGKLNLSGEAFPEVNVPLRPLTLQQVRLFGTAGELLVWRVEGGWRGRVLTDVAGHDEDRIEETHWLWGTSTHPPGPKDGFTLMRDGQQGLEHAVPREMPDPNQLGYHAALQVAHYLDYDEHGQAYIAMSRLVDVIEVKGK